MSPRNSPEAICSLLEVTNSHHIISQTSLAPLISKVRAELHSKQCTLQVDELPSLTSVFPTLADGGVDTEIEPYPNSGKPHHPDDLVVYIHSSGSTGHPKPVPQRQKQVLNWCCSGAPTNIIHIILNSGVFASYYRERTRPRDSVGCWTSSNIPYHWILHAVVRPISQRLWRRYVYPTSSRISNRTEPEECLGNGSCNRIHGNNYSSRVHRGERIQTISTFTWC